MRLLRGCAEEEEECEGERERKKEREDRGDIQDK